MKLLGIFIKTCFTILSSKILTKGYGSGLIKVLSPFGNLRFLLGFLLFFQHIADCKALYNRNTPDLDIQRGFF